MIEILITSSVLIVLLLILRRALRGRIPMSLQYGLWLLVALRLLIPGSLFSSPVSVLSGVEALRDQAAFSQVQSPAGDRGQGGQEGSGPAGPVSHAPPLSGNQSPAAPAPEGESSAPFPWGTLVRWVWWGGMALTAGWFLLANLSFRRRLLAGREPVEGADSPIPVYLAPGAGSPCLYGLFRPAIYVTPACLEEGRLSHVVAHELTHRRHGDQLWSLVRCACLILYWFDPLVWVAAVCSRRDCELACDEGALRRLGEEQRLPYGRTLVAVAAQAVRPGHLLRTATTMSSGARALLERVERIARRPRVTALAAACALTVSLLGACAVFSGAAPEESPAPSPSEDVQTVDAQEAWAEVKAALDGGEGMSDFSPTELAAAFPLSDGAYAEGIVSQLALSFPETLEIGSDFFSLELAQALIGEIYGQGGWLQADFEASLPSARSSADLQVGRNYALLERAWHSYLGLEVLDTANHLQSVFTGVSSTAEISYGLTAAYLTAYGQDASLVEVEEGNTLLALTSLIRNAAPLGYAPQSATFVATLHLTLPDGSAATLDLDCWEDLARLTVPDLAPFGVYLDYGPEVGEEESINALPSLLSLLDLTDWPQGVKDAWAPVFELGPPETASYRWTAQMDRQVYYDAVVDAIESGEGLSDFSPQALAAVYPLSDGAYAQGILSQLALSFPGVLEVDAGVLEQEEWQSLWRGVVSELHALGSPYPQLIQAALDRGTDPAGQLSLLRAAEEAWQRDNGAADPTQAIYQVVEDGYSSLLDPALDGRLTGDGDFLAVHVYVIGRESTGDFTSFYCWVYLWSCAPGDTGGYIPLSALSNGAAVTLQFTAEGWVPAPLTPFEEVPDGMAAEDFFPEGLVLDDFSAYDYDGLLAAKAQAALALQAMT